MAESQMKMDVGAEKLATDVAEDVVEENSGLTEAQEHLSGVRLLIIVLVVTVVAFLVFLDSSILVTVSPCSP
jgi:hypothetical protein